MPAYPVRPASLKDAKAVAEIHVAAWQAAFKGVLSEDQLSIVTVERRQAFWREAIDLCEPQLLVATDGNAVAGFVAFDRSRDKGTPQATGELWAIYVAPARWGSGVGRSLLQGAREGLQEEGCTEVTLWLPLHNERALRFHEAAGFKRDAGSARAIDVAGTTLEEIRLRRATA